MIAENARGDKPKTDQPYEEVLHAARLFFPPGQVTELCALGVVTTPSSFLATYSGYFDDLEKLAQAVCSLSPRAQGVYCIPNPINPQLIARACNRIRRVTDKDSLTSDKDITQRKWLFIDADAVRPAGISASDLEHAAALAKTQQIRADLVRNGRPPPVSGDSGNGGHLLWPIALAPDDRGLVQHVLKALAFRYNDETVCIDETVFNPARIWKFYGTLAAKGDSIPDRPHRQARLLEVPPNLVPVAQDLLEALAATVPPDPDPQTDRTKFSFEGDLFDLQQWITKHNLDVIGPHLWREGCRWIFRVCPWNDEHRNCSAYLIQFKNGAIAAGCHHNSCQGKNWHALRDTVEPGWREKRRNKEWAQQQSSHSEERTNGFHAAPDSSAPLDIFGDTTLAGSPNLPPGSVIEVMLCSRSYGSGY